MSTIIIPTTQNIELEYPVANVGDRILSGIVDLAILLAYLTFWGWLLNAYFDSSVEDLFSENERYITVQTIYVLATIPLACYSLITEIFFEGQTFGKKLTQTQTIRIDGSPPTLSNYLVRWVLRIVDIWLSLLIMFPGLIAMLSISISKKGQRLGDIAAGTTVVKLKLVTTFVDTIYVETEDEYEMVFKEIQNLSDRDVSILKEVLVAGIKSENPQLLQKLSEKVKEVAGINSNMPTRKFLETVLKDYNHYYKE